MGSITLKGVEKWFDQTQVIKGVDLEIKDGEFVIFVGPSGCGKSTLLRLISGLEEASRGKIFIDDEDVTSLPPSGRQLSMVFQSYALYPHMTVAENVGFCLKTSGVHKDTIRQRVNKSARMLKLDNMLDRRPKALSGGQRQRVAIGRAIVRDPKGFLFDEPLSNLDAALRVEMRFEIAKLHNELNATMIYVTHDQVEAMTLADKIVVLKDGLIQQIGSPRELYQNPDNLFVAQFIGSPKMNVMPCCVENGKVVLPQFKSEIVDFADKHEAVQLGVRPEHIKVTENFNKGDCWGKVDVVEYLGADIYIYVDTGELGRLVVRIDGEDQVKVGDEVGLSFPADKITLFAANEQVIKEY